MEDPLKESISKRLAKERLVIPTEKKKPQTNYIAALIALPLLIGLIVTLVRALVF